MSCDATIGRLHAIGLGKETTRGMAEAATVWIPKQGGALNPTFEKAVDNSAYGVIDEVFDSQTVKDMSMLSLEGVLRDSWLGNLLLGALGSEAFCQTITLTSISGGTPARGDSVSSSSSSFSGTIEKIIDIDGTDHYFVSSTSGALAGAETDFTDGTWTATVALLSNTHGHMFKRQNDNCHPSFTVYAYDDIGSYRAPYMMIDTFSIEFAVGDFGKFTTEMMGQKLETTSAQTPTYDTGTPFMAKHAAFKIADDEAGLNAASAVEVTNFGLEIAKNLVDVQAFGDTGIADIYNQNFNVSGTLEAIYKDTTFQGYVSGSTKKAARLQAINTDATVLDTGIYPSIYIDMARLSFEEFERSGDNDALTTQSLAFSGEFSTNEAMTMEVLLINDVSAAY